MPEHPHARAAARTRAKTDATKNQKSFARALNFYPPPKRAAAILDQICRLRVVGHSPLSNIHVRLAATETLARLLLEHYDRVRADSAVRHFLFTATFDDGITFENAPVVDFARIELKVRRLLKGLALDAVCVFELDVLSKPLPGAAVRLLLFHVHAVCWTCDDTFAPVKVSREQSALPQFHNQLGIPGIDFTSRAMSAARHRGSSAPDDHRFDDLDVRDQNAFSLADLARYMFKAPIAAKDRYMHSDGNWRVSYDEQAYGLNTALRLAEIWSQLSPSDAVFGVGLEGGAIARRFSVEMRALGALKAGSQRYLIERREVARAWTKLFEAHPKLGFTPSNINRRG